MKSGTVFSNEIHLVFLREDGIIHLEYQPGWEGEESGEHARQTIALISEASEQKLRPLIAFLSSKTKLSKDARDYYSSVKVTQACALIVRNPLERIIGNFFIGFNKVPIPIQLFSDQEKGLEWLEQFLD